jgi:hypothetical protein
MATTGSIFAACEAGMIPARIPTKRQMMMVVNNMGKEIYTGNSRGPDKTRVSR